MKQFVLLLSMTMVGAVASLWEPFWGVLLYYTFAVLRPQHMWAWVLPVRWRWSLYAALIVLLGVALNLHRVVIKGRFTTVTSMMIVYGVLLLISCITAHDPTIAQTWGIEYAKVMLIALIASVVIEKLWQVRMLTVMILLMLSYIAWEINYLYLFENHRLDVFHYGYGGLDNNGAGLMLAMGLPFAYAYGTSARRWWQRIGCCGFAVVILHAVMITYSRGAMLAGLVGVAWVLVHHRARIQAVLITVVLCMVISVLAGTEIRQRLMSTTNFQQDSSAQSRLDSWDAAWTLAWENPLTGQGIRNSSRYTHNYGADTQGRTIHSLYLQIAADSGFPALAAYLAMLAAAFVSLRVVRRMCRDHLPGRLSGRDPPDDDRELQQIDKLALATEGSLVIFAFGAVFLSLEMFELPWLLIVIAGLLPGAVERHLAHGTNLQAAPATITEANHPHGRLRLAGVGKGPARP